jgi:hypothetical protein
MSSPQTILTYGGGTPTITGTVTLFNSVTAFPPGGSFHLLGQQYFQWSVGFGTAADGGTGTVTGSYSDDKGVTWRTFYTKASILDGVTATPVTTEDEVYVGIYRDIRFQWTNAGEVPTVFQVNLALNCHKAASKTPTGALLVDG